MSNETDKHSDYLLVVASKDSLMTIEIEASEAKVTVGPRKGNGNFETFIPDYCVSELIWMFLNPARSSVKTHMSNIIKERFALCPKHQAQFIH